MTQKKDAELVKLDRAGDEDGYLTEIEPALSPRDQDVRLAEISQQLDREGYIDGAVAVLKRAGYDAWRNCVDHVSVAPKTDISP